MKRTMTELIVLAGQVAFALALSVTGYVAAEAGSRGSSTIVAKIKWCEWRSPISTVVVPEVCREEEIVSEGHEISSQMECIRGVSMAAGAFWFPPTKSWWVLRGGTCVEKHNPYLDWKMTHKKGLD